MYHGAYELNYTRLHPGQATYKSTEGDERPLPAWPPKADGLRVAYMEKSGKKFYAVRVQYGDHDVVLENPIVIDPLKHMNNQRFSAEPIVVSDDGASALLDDIIRDNPDKQKELALMINQINQIRRATRAQPKS
jgi:hypothetical protein